MKGLFRGYNLSLTWRVIIATSNTQFISSGCSFILPFMFTSSGMGIFEFFLVSLGEIPASLIVYFMVDAKSIGRIRIVYVSLFCCFISCILLYIFQESFLLIGLGCLMFFSKFASLASWPVVSETYDTVYRSLGLGICIAVGRAVGAVAPFALYEIFLADKWSIFLLFALILLVTALVFVSFPIDNTQKSNPQKIEDF